MPLPRTKKICIAAGLCALIPLPFFDELIKRMIMNRTVARWSVAGGEPINRQTLLTLTRDNRNWMIGCLLACCWWPIKKLFKTILYFLTIKECFDWATDTHIRLAMIELAIGRGQLVEHAEEMRKLMDAAIEQHTASPCVRILQSRSVPKLNDSISDPMDRLLDTLVRAAGGDKALQQYESQLDQLMGNAPG